LRSQSGGDASSTGAVESVALSLPSTAVASVGAPSPSLSRTSSAASVDPPSADEQSVTLGTLASGAWHVSPAGHSADVAQSWALVPLGKILIGKGAHGGARHDELGAEPTMPMQHT
jgi:hypothetical protein